MEKTMQQNNNEQETRLFNPNDHVMQLKSREGSKDYLPIQWRLVWFRSVCPQGTIDTEEILVDLDREVEVEAFVWNPEKRRSEKTIKRARGYARYRAVVTDGKGGRATGTKSENAASFPDYAEKAETGAIGRALAGLGYGTQFTGDEFSEQERLADAPVERVQPAQGQTPSPQPGRITENQLKSIRNLCKCLGREMAEGTELLGEQNARETIAVLSQQWREKQLADRLATEPAESQPDEPPPPSGADLQAEVAALGLVWKEVLVKALSKQLKEGKLNIANLVAAGPNLSPAQRKQVAAYLLFIKK
jgi:hypothetical protein